MSAGRGVRSYACLTKPGDRTVLGRFPYQGFPGGSTVDPTALAPLILSRVVPLRL